MLTRLYTYYIFISDTINQMNLNVLTSDILLSLKAETHILCRSAVLNDSTTQEQDVQTVYRHIHMHSTVWFQDSLLL